MATAKKNQKPAGEATKGIKVTARPAIFRRAGYTFTAEATVIPLDELSEEQLAQIESEPNLVSQRVDIAPPAETPAAA